MQKDNTTLNIRRQRLQNALLGLFIGDALAMPAHWYYNPDNIAKVFGGGIRGYVDPPHPHLESFMVGMSYHPDLQTAFYVLKPTTFSFVQSPSGIHQHRLPWELPGGTV